MLKFEYICTICIFSVPQFCGRITAITFAQSNFIVAFVGLWGCSSCCSYDNGDRSRLLFLYIIASASVAVAVGVAVAIVIVVVVSVARCVCSIFKICKLSSVTFYRQKDALLPQTHTHTTWQHNVQYTYMSVCVCVCVLKEQTK